MQANNTQTKSLVRVWLHTKWQQCELSNGMHCKTVTHTQVSLSCQSHTHTTVFHPMTLMLTGVHPHIRANTHLGETQVSSTWQQLILFDQQGVLYTLPLPSSVHSPLLFITLSSYPLPACLFIFLFFLPVSSVLTSFTYLLWPSTPPPPSILTTDLHTFFHFFLPSFSVLQSVKTHFCLLCCDIFQCNTLIVVNSHAVNVPASLYSDVGVILYLLNAK